MVEGTVQLNMCFCHRGNFSILAHFQLAKHKTVENKSNDTQTTDRALFRRFERASSMITHSIVF